MKLKFLIGAGVIVLVVAALSGCTHFGWIVLAGPWFAILRWIAIILFAGYALERSIRSRGITVSSVARVIIS